MRFVDKKFSFFETFFKKGIAIFGEMWYNIIRCGTACDERRRKATTHRERVKKKVEKTFEKPLDKPKAMWYNNKVGAKKRSKHLKPEPKIFLKKFSHQLYCVTLTVCYRKGKKNDHLHHVTLHLNKDGRR